MIHIKYCKRCGQAYDYGTNYDICSDCRLEDITKRKEGEINGRID